MKIILKNVLTILKVKELNYNMKLYSVGIYIDDGIIVKYKHHYVYASSEEEVKQMLEFYYDTIDYWIFKYEYIHEVEDARILKLER